MVTVVVERVVEMVGMVILMVEVVGMVMVKMVMVVTPAPCPLWVCRWPRTSACTS